LSPSLQFYLPCTFRLRFVSHDLYRRFIPKYTTMSSDSSPIDAALAAVIDNALDSAAQKIGSLWDKRLGDLQAAVRKSFAAAEQEDEVVGKLQAYLNADRVNEGLRSRLERTIAVRHTFSEVGNLHDLDAKFRPGAADKEATYEQDGAYRSKVPSCKKHPIAKDSGSANPPVKRQRLHTSPVQSVEPEGVGEEPVIADDTVSNRKVYLHDIPGHWIIQRDDPNFPFGPRWFAVLCNGDPLSGGPISAQAGQGPFRG
ncbi:hypothetical protein GE09DRAFT_1247024, partial [Coniochaeta sp. 2T2.1]